MTKEILSDWTSDQRPRVFFDLPVMYKRPDVVKAMLSLYEDSKASFLIPPKPFLGSKAVLGIVRNDEEDPEIEKILADYVDRQDLEIVRAHIPKTFLASKNRRSSVPPDLLLGGRYVLKAVVSGGMKGTAFPEDPGYWDKVLQAYRSSYHTVLQREIRSHSLKLRHFEDERVRISHWFGRFTVYFVDGQVADGDLTARRDKKVHGALDSLQLGIAIEKGVKKIGLPPRLQAEEPEEPKSEFYSPNVMAWAHGFSDSPWVLRKMR